MYFIGNQLCVMRGSSALDVDKAVQSAKEAQKAWGSLTGLERGKIMSRAGRIIKVLHLLYSQHWLIRQKYVKIFCQI